MYQVYIKTKSSYEGRKLIGKFKEYDEAWEKIEEELSKDKDIKYVIEETTGSVDIYGELIVDVVEEN